MFVGRRCGEVGKLGLGGCAGDGSEGSVLI